MKSPLSSKSKFFCHLSNLTNKTIFFTFIDISIIEIVDHLYIYSILSNLLLNNLAYSIQLTLGSISDNIIFYYSSLHPPYLTHPANIHALFQNQLTNYSLKSFPIIRHIIKITFNTSNNFSLNSFLLIKHNTFQCNLTVHKNP